jgi:hypothetical protein
MMGCTEYEDLCFEPITAPVPAPGWMAVYENEDGEPGLDPLIGWVLYRVRSYLRKVWRDENGKYLRIEKGPTTRCDNRVCGMVLTDSTTEVAEEEDNFRGYLHKTGNLDTFCRERFQHAKWRPKTTEAAPLSN